MGMVVLQWVLSRGPPWARETGESNQRLLLLVLGLGVAVLVLFVMVLFLWSKQSGTGQSSPPQTGTGAAEEPDEYEQIRRIDSTVDGKLPQQEIVKQTNWSEAKVSRVVSRLAEDGRLEKVRIGRQNFIQVSNEEKSDSTEPEPGDAT